MRWRLIYLSFVICHLSFSPARAQHHIVFTTQWLPESQFAGYYVAKEKGFYKEVGLDVEIIPPPPTQSAFSHIRENKSQAVMMDLCQAMGVIDKGIPMVNILQTSMNSSSMIISRTNKNPLTMKGARVAISEDFGHMARCMSKKEGLDYEWIPISMSISLFMKGVFDALVGVSYSEYFQMQQSGLAITEEGIYRLGEHGYNVQEDGVYMTLDYYRTHKRQAQMFAQASKKGWEWAASHEEETLDIVMKYVQESHIATNRTMQKLMLREVLRLQLDKQSGKREFRLRPDMVKLASKLMVEEGLLENEVKYGQLIHR